MSRTAIWTVFVLCLAASAARAQSPGEMTAGTTALREATQVSARTLRLDAAGARALTQADDDGHQGFWWTGMSLLASGGMLINASFFFNDSKGCGMFRELSCDRVKPVYITTGALMAGTGLTLMLIDDQRLIARRKARAQQRVALDLGPRAVLMRIAF